MSKTPKLDEYTKKREVPLSFLTKDTEDELTTEDLNQMRQICQMPVFQKRVDAHVRRVFKQMTKESFDINTGIMDAMAVFAGEFEDAEEAYQERVHREKVQAEMATPDPFPDLEQDEAHGEIPDE